MDQKKFGGKFQKNPHKIGTQHSQILVYHYENIVLWFVAWSKDSFHGVLSVTESKTMCSVVAKVSHG